ncbi:MAG TPA: phosphatase PAP2 family protein [Dermatophilaceae bacterium]
MGIGVRGSQGTTQTRWPSFLAAVGAMALAAVLGLAATAYVALRTSRGLRLDVEAMNAVGSPRLALYRLHEGLTWVSVGSVALSLLACVALALVRRRFDLALGAVVVIGGSNVTTQILKYHVITRPDLSQAPNSLPSGHTTVALSIALAAVIVAPSAWRSIVAIGVSATATLVGVATVLGRWHRPSDVVAATFVCLLWAALGLLTAALVGHRLSGNAPHVSVHLGALIGASAVGGLLVLWGVRPQAGMRDLGLGLISLGAIGLACAVSVAAVARIADRHLE